MNGIDVEDRAGETRLILEPVLDIMGARDLYGKLNAVLTQRKPVALDASRVERVDTAALQLLTAFCRAAREGGLALSWHGISPALADAAATLGLGETLGRQK